MGSDAEVYVFDDPAFHAQVVPFFRRLLRHGGVEPALAGTMDRIRPHADQIRRHVAEDWAGLRPTDLDTHCTYLGDDLRVVDAPSGLARKLATGRKGWEDRDCHRHDCPARATCPFFVEDGGRQADAFSFLFQAVVAAVCLGESQFVGRSFNVFDYDSVLRKNGISWDGELGRLLTGLGIRGAVVGYGFANSDGIHGWLSHEETGRLAELLEAVSLPPLEPSFGAMKRTRGPDGGYEIEGWEWEQLSLGFVKTVATIASGRGLGILWGNDLANVLTGPT